MKICIVTPSLGFGGAERSAAMQSIMLSEMGYEVHIVLISNLKSYDYKGTLCNLGILKDNSNTFYDKIKRINFLRKYLIKNKFDFIIDNRLRNNSIIHEFGICKYAYRKFKVIYVIHSSSYKKEILQNFYLKKWLLNSAHKIVAVNNRLLDLIRPFHNNKNMVCIENAIDLDYIRLQSNESLNIPFSYILFCGRLDEKSKNISLLINAYALSEIYIKGIKLIILGDGPDKSDYEQLVTRLKMNDYIIFKPFNSNPFVYMKHSLCTVLTSFYEGFGLVLIESLASGTPVISVDCETGPSEIVEHNVNGLLIDPDSVNLLSEAFKSVIGDKDMLNRFRKNALNSVQKFRKNVIAEKWRVVLEN
ncbi:PglA protein [Mariniflexile rhizosphaerae]|uniref:glycosyltransferase n=1 Tax=unclassified Mariniflexile TaxID=2643887 RepID=UPI000CC8C3A5|nr:glycosyltransferase [Mariniflexile sp. TRM1-10]AXP81728.1 PglA protein [Mariniflexile sp. TRM1-10]PLB20892.1 MAG: Glycosyl transferase family 1 [Flavobacteriaceae bacterium FS1-H7996/R]